MDVLYILGNGSRWNNNEIKYSLRSLEKHAKNVGRVFITGEKPDFINDKIIYNYFPDDRIATINHFNKVLFTFKNTDISDNILLNYDDNFFIKDANIEKYPYFYSKNEISANYHINTFYTNSLTFTRNLLLKLKKPIKDFSVHTPIVYNRQKFYEMEEIIKEHCNFDNPRSVGVSVRSLYCNLNDIKGKIRADLKFHRDLPIFEIEKRLENESVFSTSDRIYDDMANYIFKTYPEKSRWEK
jgi:hypothetical protein